MRLKLDFDDELMRSYDLRKSSPFFTIYWTSGQMAYPEEGWMDFGAVVLSWWLVTARQLVDGAGEGDLPFMDGPFRLNVRSIGDIVSVSAADLDQPWRVPRETFVHELLNGAQRVQVRLQELGLDDKTGLGVGIKQLELAVTQQQRHELRRTSAEQIVQR